MVRIVGVVYTLSVNQSSPVLQQQPKDSIEAVTMETGIQGHCKLDVRGPRLNESMIERTSVVYGSDYRLSWTVCPPAPQLQVLIGTVCSVYVCVCVCAIHNTYVCTLEIHEDKLL